MPPAVTPVQDLAIEAEGVTRRFGARWVLRGISLRVAPGEIVGLLGANGSGKSTLLRIFATLLRPNGGTARVSGADVTGDADAVRRRVGFLAHSTGLYEDLTARENLKFAATMLGRAPGDLDALLERVGLTPVADRRVRGYSAGMQRRLSLARLLLASPRVLLLDEPYSNLDADGIALMNTMLRGAAASGAAALVVLHETAPAAGLLDWTVTIADGRIAHATEFARPRPASAHQPAEAR
ncbi:MAG: heme ABC exporter ATP-binding protein CcmA [Gemmatimonadaceae bacterium]